MVKNLVHNEGHAHIQMEGLSLIAQVKKNGFLTAEELCRRSGLSLEDLKELNNLKLLTPDTADGLYRSDLVHWAGELAFQIGHAADLNKLVELLNVFWNACLPVHPDWHTTWDLKNVNDRSRFQNMQTVDDSSRLEELENFCGDETSTIVNEDAKNENHIKEDTFLLYKFERLTFDADATEFPVQLYYDYQKWCGQNGYAIMSEKEFGFCVKNLLGKPVLRLFDNDKYRLVYLGVRLKA